MIESLLFNLSISFNLALSQLLITEFLQISIILLQLISLLLIWRLILISKLLKILVCNMIFCNFSSLFYFLLSSLIVVLRLRHLEISSFSIFKFHDRISIIAFKIKSWHSSFLSQIILSIFLLHGILKLKLIL